MRRCSYAACCFTDASGIRVTDSRYNGPANTGRTRSAARTVPKGREGRRDKKKESSYASRDADTTVRETRTVKRTRRERRSRVQVETGFSPWHAPFAECRSAEREGGKGSASFPSGRPIESDGGRCIFCANERGKKNWEYEMNLREKAQSGKQARAIRYVFEYTIYTQEGKRIRSR